MSEVKIVKVEEKDSDARLDRWFKRYYPALSHGMLEKMLRAKNIRVNGARAKADLRLQTGDEIRVPPMPKQEEKATKELSKADIEFIQSLVIYKDKDIIVLNKPAGLAVQGGTKTLRHVDGLLDGLKFGGERPRLVHRLDKETSGVLALARNVKMAAYLTKAFKTKEAHKIYWAVVHGCPKQMQGEIEVPLLKKSGKNGGESVQVDENGQYAKSLYEVVDTTGDYSLLRLMPLTGRTHQLRVHCAYIGCPIVGDEKYGGHFVDGLEKKMLLHAKALQIPLLNQKKLKVDALIPDYMKKSLAFFNFNVKKEKESFDFF
ncbi:MAG: RluA family pseudouridine synthase [Alphaproteobacteria bacterium]|nr:RluA family pseudouridine synthase [Alphaproteobacteria bacterium]